MIDSFDGPYFFLSNFYPAVVKLDGHTYPTVEHAYQAAKFTDPATRAKIAVCRYPGQAKRLGNITALTEEQLRDWEGRKIDVMRRLLVQKFALGTALGRELINTGDHELIEGNNWQDKFWGMCDGEGQNWLGRLLMEIRAELHTTLVFCGDGHWWAI